jgi:hypothetical protein
VIIRRVIFFDYGIPDPEFKIQVSTVLIARARNDVSGTFVEAVREVMVIALFQRVDVGLIGFRHTTPDQPPEGDGLPPKLGSDVGRPSVLAHRGGNQNGHEDAPRKKTPD